jgi:hypothetical protein
MGIVSLLQLAVTAGGVLAQRAQARKATQAQTESNSITQATQFNQDAINRRRLAREERIKRGRLTALSENSTGGLSSGEFGSVSSIGADFAASFANQQGQQVASEGISKQNQLFSDAQTKYDNIGAFTDMVTKGLDLWKEYKKPI